MRAFIAIDIPGDIRKKICDFGAMVPGNATIVSEQNLHITVQFLGDIGQKVQSDVVETIKTIDERPFSVSIAGVSGFGKGDDIRVLYAGVRNGEKIKEIYTSIMDSFSSKGLRFDRESDYVPHVTICRPKGASSALSDFIRSNKDKVFGGFEVSKVSLKKSTLARNGPVYETLYERELL